MSEQPHVSAVHIDLYSGEEAAIVVSRAIFDALDALAERVRDKCGAMQYGEFHATFLWRYASYLAARSGPDGAARALELATRSVHELSAQKASAPAPHEELH